MGFNKDLFIELCKEYNVKFSKKYKDVMLIENGQNIKLSDLTYDDFRRILFIWDTNLIKLQHG